MEIHRKENNMDEAVKKLVLEILREKLTVEVETETDYSGDSRYESLRVTVKLDGTEVCSDSTLLNIK